LIPERRNSQYQSSIRPLLPEVDEGLQTTANNLETLAGQFIDAFISNLSSLVRDQTDGFHPRTPPAGGLD
jgi:hypothetical protein